MIRYQNFPRYGEESFKDGNKTLTEFSIPVKVGDDGTGQYIRSFGTLVLDEIGLNMKLKKYDTSPFYTEDLKGSRKLTKEPRYDVPSSFVKDMEKLGLNTPEEDSEMKSERSEEMERD